MALKTFLLIVLVFSTILAITSEVAAAKELASNHDHGEVKDDKHDHHDRGYYNDGPYDNGGCRRHHKRDGHGRGNCRYGCCGGGGFYNDGCRCCSTLTEAIAYKQTHN